ANPQRPEIMAQITGCLEGMADACRALDFPIVSGNVSLYNESKATGGGSAILPTPAIGGVGLIQDWRKAVGIGFKHTGDRIFLIGHPKPSLGQSTWLREIAGLQAGDPPHVNLTLERETAEIVRSLIDKGLVNAVHDVSDGGLLVAVAEMALAGSIGMVGGDYLTCTPRMLFGEMQAMYVVTVPHDVGQEAWNDFLRASSVDGVPALWLGSVEGEAITIADENGEPETSIPLANLRTAHEGFFPRLMGADAALA
ncbi:MAG: phosphoribosylformylglycinamidine synthase II, partial [Sphingopyxis sp.]|nr:phosphoribosylformylglycinamidine synthase II [Sphingopyxis sp.]